MSININLFTTAKHNVKHRILEIFFCVSLLAICSQISISLSPVPITLQTVAALFIGLFYNKTSATLSVLSYLTLGAMGLPIFANFSFGVMALIGPRGGYLIGFLLAVYIMSILKNKLFNNKIFDQIFLCIIGNIVIMALGFLWLASFIGTSKALEFGVLPFIVPGIIKSVLLIAFIRIVRPQIYQ
jgi:biotin transport system substrate-specific component